MWQLTKQLRTQLSLFTAIYTYRIYQGRYDINTFIELL